VDRSRLVLELVRGQGLAAGEEDHAGEYG
jgi:hypothetical protein